MREMYLLRIWGCVEPELFGPFGTQQERDEQARGLFGEEHIVFKLFLQDAIPFVEAYSGGEVDDLIGQAKRE